MSDLALITPLLAGIVAAQQAGSPTAAAVGGARRLLQQRDTPNWLEEIVASTAGEGSELLEEGGQEGG